MSETTVTTDKRTFRARTMTDGFKLFWGLVDALSFRCWMGMWFTFIGCYWLSWIATKAIRAAFR